MRAGQQTKAIICRGIRWGDFDVRNSCIAVPHSPLRGGTARMAMGMGGLYVGIAWAWWGPTLVGAYGLRMPTKVGNYLGRGSLVEADLGRRLPFACASQGWHLPGRMGHGRGRPWSAHTVCVRQPRLAPTGA